MSPLVQQIIQRLDLLPDSALRQVLALVDGLLSSLQNTQDAPSSYSSPDDMSNLENHGGIWLIKATKQPISNYNSVLFQVREERIDNLTQW
ncbi:MAG: hypothetical protein AAF821_21530 [Cyanobacteria bacterium P01_D01_bin.156]